MGDRPHAGGPPLLPQPPDRCLSLGPAAPTSPSGTAYASLSHFTILVPALSCFLGAHDLVYCSCCCCCFLLLLPPPPTAAADAVCVDVLVLVLMFFLLLCSAQRHCQKDGLNTATRRDSRTTTTSTAGYLSRLTLPTLSTLPRASPLSPPPPSGPLLWLCIQRPPLQPLYVTATHAESGSVCLCRATRESTYERPAASTSVPAAPTSAPAAPTSSTTGAARYDSSSSIWLAMYARVEPLLLLPPCLPSFDLRLSRVHPRTFSRT